MKLGNSTVLKIAIFTTGLSGIVAEYALATLATYFLGNQLVQWTLIISIMLFAMGLGSRLSRFFNNNLIETFIVLEAILSLLIGCSALIVYSLAALTHYEPVLIYILCISIGLLIGLEIPLVTRINNNYETLKTNISSILEKDYYGSLIGGVFFAFVGLPFLGFTYTPLILGALNLAVSVIMFLKLRFLLTKSSITKIIVLQSLVIVVLLGSFGFANDILLWGDQTRYKDKVVFNQQTKYQKITVTQWKDHFWLYINHNQQLSSIDEFMYHEPLVHPIMMQTRAKNILVIGGGDGCAVREILKYPFVEKITLVDLDPEMTKLGKENSIFNTLNDSAFWNKKVTIINDDGKRFLENNDQYYEAIIIDLPDPKTIELGMLYSREFYNLAYSKLQINGLIITQAGSPYYATKAFYCIEKTMQSAGFKTLPLQNQILTMGQWGWIIGSKNQNKLQLQNAIKEHFSIKTFTPKTQWLNTEALDHIFSFGKPLVDTQNIEINTLNNPVLYQYYSKGNWDLY